jgi:uncharacterized protein (DUF433 family)
MSRSTVIIDCNPEINFGEPFISESNIGVAAIRDRFLSGESVASVAEDYGISSESVESAIAYELRRLFAASE